MSSNRELLVRVARKIEPLLGLASLVADRLERLRQMAKGQG